LKWYEIIIFLIISISLLTPEFILNRFYPKYNFEDVNNIQQIKLDPNKETRFKVTRMSDYGERYKLFVIKEKTFEKEFTLQDYGITLTKEKNKTIVDTLKWNGQAKKDGFQMGDIISEFKIENANRPDKDIVYPFGLMLLLIFGYFNYRRNE